MPLITNTLTVSKSYVNIKRGIKTFSFLHTLFFESCSYLLLISFFSVDETNVESKTALHLACEAGFKEIIEILMSFGASVNTTDKDGKTPLELLHLKSMFKEMHKELVEREYVYKVNKMIERTKQYKKEKNYFTLRVCLKNA